MVTFELFVSKVPLEVELPDPSTSYKVFPDTQNDLSSASMHSLTGPPITSAYRVVPAVALNPEGETEVPTSLIKGYKLTHL